MIQKDRVIYLKDTVSYNGLIAGTEYTMTGTLMDKATGAPFAGAEPVTKAFTPRVSSGTVEIEFEVDAAQLERQDCSLRLNPVRKME